MGFQIPEYLQSYLNKKNDSPYENFVNTSLYYANTNTYVMDYLNRVVRQCMAYGCGVRDGGYNGGLSANIGYSAIKNATKIIKGDKTIFTGDDQATAFISDTWAQHARFDIFLDELIMYMLQGGTALFKLNMDKYGRCSLTTSRVDRNTFVCADNGDIVGANFLMTMLSSTENAGSVNEQLWLVERRYYDEDGKPTIVFHVHRKSGTAQNETLPQVEAQGIPYEALSKEAKIVIRRMGITLDTPEVLPFKDGLGVWSVRNTSVNSCVPGLKMGDPALYGTLDLLWSIDTVFGGSIIDVLNGEGKVLVPKRFLGNLNALIKNATGVNPEWHTLDAAEEGANGFVYVSSPHDKEFPPTNVQFDIRSEQYRAMWELYLKQFAVCFGYAPTTLFPYLQDASPKTAREVTAEENLTRASVQSAHRMLLPEINRAIAEVLYQTGFVGKVTVQMSDYIGNKMLRDENARQNYAAGLLPHETAVQLVNGLSAKETAEFMEKIAAEQKESAFGGKVYDESDYFGG